MVLVFVPISPPNFKAEIDNIAFYPLPNSVIVSCESAVFPFSFFILFFRDRLSVKSLVHFLFQTVLAAESFEHI